MSVENYKIVRLFLIFLTIAILGYMVFNILKPTRQECIENGGIWDNESSRCKEEKEAE